MQIPRVAARKTGLDSDWWTAYQFDNAITWAGGYIENKLSEYDAKGNRKYTLEFLLADRNKPKNPTFEEMKRMAGMLG